jgi:hypothetical protein
LAKHRLFREWKLLAIVLGLLIAVIAAWPYLPPSDPPTYFAFADNRMLWGIPNAGDVLSNLGSLWAGMVGAFLLLRSRGSYTPLFFITATLIIAAILTSFGSAYFHWDPSPETLLWDRLPMTIKFSGIAAMILADRVHPKLGLLALIAAIPIGLFTVTGFAFNWITLKPYIALQFGSLMLVALMMIVQPKGRIKNKSLWAALGFYAAAKIFEVYDVSIYQWSGFVSGHTLKHIFAAIAIWQLLRALTNALPTTDART